MSNRQFNLASFTTFTMNVTTAGTPEQLTKKLTGTGIAFVEGGENVDDTITDTGSDFLNAGFQPGDRVTITGSSGGTNDKTVTIKSVVAGTITLEQDSDLANESAGASVKLVSPVLIPEGIGIRIKAKKGNTGDIYIGNSADTADKDASPQAGWILDANESLELQVVSSDLIWVDATVSGEGVEVILERNLRA